MLTLYVVWWLVGLLEMDLLSAVLGQFASVGVFIIVVIFQQEIRRFLLLLGNSTLKQQHFNFIRRFIERDLQDIEQRDQQIQIISRALLRMGKRKTGALIVFAKNITLDGITSSGIPIGATITEGLLESIFNKESPLHDGAVLIEAGKIYAARCPLPTVDNPSLPPRFGMRHRAALGITELTDSIVVVVSEERGKISVADNTEINENIKPNELREILSKERL